MIVTGVQETWTLATTPPVRATSMRFMAAPLMTSTLLGKGAKFSIMTASHGQAEAIPASVATLDLKAVWWTTQGWYDSGKDGLIRQ